jgi:hypothetical protein
LEKIQKNQNLLKVVLVQTLFQKILEVVVEHGQQESS